MDGCTRVVAVLGEWWMVVLGLWLCWESGRLRHGCMCTYNESRDPLFSQSWLNRWFIALSLVINEVCRQELGGWCWCGASHRPVSP